ncbi:hypothetical protein GYA13_03845 [Candidatus Kuenenbacteria bacterium]|nr:hypothetical protein [Candidatus Kuenenbacteria bacterium]
MSEETTQEKGVVEQRQGKSKELIIEQLKKTPIIQLACEKNGVGRATFYRWRKSDKDFAEAVDQALSEGSSLVNDLAESQLMSAIKNGNLTAIIFWLKYHHSRYTTRVEVTAEVKNLNQQLTPGQQKIVDEALRLAALTDDSAQGKEQNNEQPIINA